MSQPIVHDIHCYDSKRVTADLVRLAERYSCLKVYEVGRSVIGHAIYAIEIDITSQADSYPSMQKILWNGAFHANEWMTTPLLMKMVEELATAIHHGNSYQGQDIQKILTNRKIYVIPMVNPDGVDLVLHGVNQLNFDKAQLIKWNQGSLDFSRWKANIRGVDLNDQFPAFWTEEVARRQVKVPAWRDYPGTSPLSEPEAQAIAKFTLFHEFDMLICLHMQGKEIYWNYRGMEPTYSQQLAEHMALSCGYCAIAITNSDAGFKDWFIQEFRKPGFTVEVGEGVNPLPIDQFNSCFEEVSKLLLSSLAWNFNLN